MDIDLLSKMVKDLILDNDEVSLPGVGTFVAELVPSTFSDKGYTINPPYRRLYFRQRKETSDTALVELYAKANNIDEERAKQIIDDFLSEMKDVLRQKKTIIFPGLGRLRATKENNIFFVADEDLDIYPSGFGLNPISLKTHVETSEEVAAAVASLKDLVAPPVAVAPEPEKTEEKVEEAEKTPSAPKETYEEPKMNIFSPVAASSEPKPIPEGMEEALTSKETETKAEAEIVPAEEPETEPATAIDESKEEPPVEESATSPQDDSTATEEKEETPIEEEIETIPEEIVEEDIQESESPSVDTGTEEVLPSEEDDSSVESPEDIPDQETHQEPTPEEDVPEDQTKQEEYFEEEEEGVIEEVISISEPEEDKETEETDSAEVPSEDSVEEAKPEEESPEKEEDEEKVSEEKVEEEVSAPVIVEEKPLKEDKPSPEAPHTADAKAMSDKVAAMIKEKKAVVTTPSVLNEPEKKEGLPLWAKIIIWIFGILLALLIIYMIVARVAPNFIDSILYSPEDLEFLREGKI